MWNLIRKLLGIPTGEEGGGQRDNDRQDIDSVLEILSSGDEEAAEQALESLARMAADHESRITILNKMIVHPSGLVRRRVPSLLDSLADDPLEPLLEMYYAGDGELTEKTRKIFRLRSNLTAPLLFDRVRGQDETDRRRALEILVAMGSDAVPNLLEAMSDPSTTVRTSAVLCLARMGDEARMAVSTLIEALNDENEDVRFRAAFALKRMGGIEYQDQANAVIEELAEPLGALDTLEIYVADNQLQRARILPDHPVTGELMTDSTGARFLAPEEDYRGGGMGSVKVLGHASVIKPHTGKIVKVTGIWDRELGLFAAEINPVN